MCKYALFLCLKSIKHLKVDQRHSACIPAGTGRLMVKSSENEELEQEVFLITTRKLVILIKGDQGSKLTLN